MAVTNANVSGSDDTIIPIAVDGCGDVDYQVVKHAFGATGLATLVDEAHGLPVEDVHLRALLKRIVAVLERIESKL